MASHRLDSKDVNGLAALHAALDPDRRKWRSDITISSIIAVLASQGRMTLRQLRDTLKSLWLTDAINSGVIHETLKWAEGENLVESHEQNRDTYWAATPSSVAEAKLDRKIASAYLYEFQKDIQKRLDILCEGRESISEGRAEGLAHDLVSALLAGSEPVFAGVMSSASPSRLQDIRFDETAVYDYLRNHVNPPSLQENLRALCCAVFDPTNEFGTEILRLIVTGKFLQGMMAWQDLPGPTPVPGSTLLLDTSALMYKIYPGGPHAQLLEDFLRVSQSVDCKIIVTEAVLREWASVWRAGDKEAHRLENSATGIPTRGWQYEDNAPVRYWLWKRDVGQPQTWQLFRQRNSNIEAWLLQRGVQILGDGKADPELIEQLREALVREAGKSHVKKRTATKARTDAYSAAVVTEVRERGPAPIPRSWFIAQDRLTNKAYADVRPGDPFPLTATVETWLLLLSATQPRDPAEMRNMAEIMGQAVIRESFLSLCANFTAQDLIDLVEDLKKEPEASEEYIAEQFRSELFAQGASEEGDFQTAVARHRAMRRHRQLTIKQERINAMEQDLLSTASEAERRDRLQEDKIRQLEVKNTRLKHVCYLATGLALLGLGIMTSVLLGAPTFMVIVAAVAWVAWGIEGIIWLCKTPSVSAWVFILGVSATIAWTVLAGLLGVVFAHPAPTHPAPTRPPSVSASTSGRPTTR